MKSLVAPILVMASFATIAISCLGAATALQAPYRPHEFQNLNSGIWTSGPVRIDRENQNFERLAAVSPAAAPTAAMAMNDPLGDRAPAVEASSTGQVVARTATANAVNELCQQKYRSYRSEDNSYQPMSGGPRRQCEISPVAEIQNAQISVPPVVSGSSSLTDHAEWCQTRYSSYKASDNTYQPFGGGQRRSCISPTTVAVNG